MKPDRWAIVMLLEDVSAFIAQNPNEADRLAQNTALIEYLVGRLEDLYSTTAGEILQ